MIALAFSPARLATVALGLVAAVRAPLHAQSLGDAEARVAPQWVQYRVHAPASETISELAIPVFVTIPAGSRLTVDVGTAYARAQVASGALRSDVAGLTDTQLRGNFTLGDDFVVLTAGVNLPTGRSSISLDQLAAAGRIGNDFLDFPVSNMGTGLAATGGVAIARPVGEWSVGAGVAVRRSATYEPFDIPDESFRYQPGNEVRARVGADRPLGAGRLALGVTYAAFGRDDADGSAYDTGDRVVAQGALTGIVAGQEFTVAAYDLLRAPGFYASGERAGRENLANVFLSLGVHALGSVIEPSVELRQWLQNADAGDVSSRASRLATFGLRVRAGVAGLTLYPSATYAIGSLAAADQAGLPVQARLTGFRVGLAAAASP
ncbi:MAG TPA: hypothetical protein VFP90_00835 [Gemmatimonadaceae bacterium]|nr:hypothetical protein [Gemmatimonadaceae bacterium]